MTTSSDQVKRVLPAGAERVAEALRRRITSGQLKAGDKLREEKLAEELGASRNTLREGFRLLTLERLLVHVPNRGVRVRTLDLDDVIDLYRMRTLVELGALDSAAIQLQNPDAVALVTEARDAGLDAANYYDWNAVGTANIAFHLAITSLAGSKRLVAAMTNLLAEQRLAFGLVSNLRSIHEPYFSTNSRIASLISEGDFIEARRELDVYLRMSRDQLVATFGGPSV